MIGTFSGRVGWAVLLAVSPSFLPAKTRAPTMPGWGPPLGPRDAPALAGNPSWEDPPDLPAEARCGTYWVYENAGAASGRLIPLRVIVLPATEKDRAPDPVFLLAGGPGQAISDLVWLAEIQHEATRERRDLALVDQRGTGGSHALPCFPFGLSDIRTYFSEAFGLESVVRCRDVLAARADLRSYLTHHDVGDLEAGAARGLDTACLERLPLIRFRLPD